MWAAGQMLEVVNKKMSISVITYTERLDKLGLISLRRRRESGNRLMAFEYVKGCCGEGGNRLFSVSIEQHKQ